MPEPAVTEEVVEALEPSGVAEVIVDTDEMKRQAVEALNKLNSTPLHESGFTIASASNLNYVPVDNSAFSEAKRQRNSMFEKKYSTTLIEFSDDTEVMLENAYLNMLSGIYYTDIFSIPQNQLSSFISRGILLKTASIPNGDFTKGYYDRGMMSETVYGFNDYAIYGDFNRDISNYYCIYLNCDLAKEAGVEIPYDKVRQGSWTWDGLVEMIRLSTVVSDAAGMASSNIGFMTKAVYKSSGKSFLYKGYGADPTIAYGGANTDAVISALRSIGGYKTVYNENATEGSAVSEFMAGRSLFYIGRVGEMAGITNMPYDFTVLPLPKVDSSADDYYSYISPEHAVIAVYAGSRCTEMADALNGLYAASSGGYLTEAYYRELIDTSIRNSNALDMMDYICGVKGGKAVNDFVDIYPECRTFTVDALAKAVYNYDLTAEDISGRAKNELGNIFNNRGSN